MSYSDPAPRPIEADQAFGFLAGKTVRSIRFVEGHAMRIVFDDESELQIGAHAAALDEDGPRRGHLVASLRRLEPIHRQITKPADARAHRALDDLGGAGAGL